jgi:nicotinamide riboside kinase
VLTGPESSGKTTLATLMSEKFKYPIVLEFARTYLNNKKQEGYSESDLNEIAIGQCSSENIVASKIICDTDLLTLYIWKQEVYGKCDLKWRKEISNYKKNRFYFLCKPDIEWEPDPLRENQHDRDRIYEVYKENLNFFDLPFIELEGSIENRMLQLEKII